MRCSLKKLLLCIFLLWLVHLFHYVVIRILHHPAPQKNEIIVQIGRPSSDEGNLKGHKTVEIWGKAAIGRYLWEHVFEGSLKSDPGSLIETDSLLIDGFKLKYSAGFNVNPDSVNHEAESAIVVLNGRDFEKISFSRKWLDSLLLGETFPRLRNLGLVLHGNEQCNNSWLQSYLKTYGNILKFAFIVYDIPDADNKKIFQWPLGVATYRNFPVIPKILLNAEIARPHRCNFLGTVYSGSSREKLYKILQSQSSDVCFVKVRWTWEPNESRESMALYQKVIRESDLTLCPVGKNSEAYRIYEAMSYGSVPVIEDVMTPGNCGTSEHHANYANASFRLLKLHKAPVIFVKDWSQLLSILRREESMTQREIFARHLAVLDWYQKFKYRMRNKLLAVVKKTFT